MLGQILSPVNHLSIFQAWAIFLPIYWKFYLNSKKHCNNIQTKSLYNMYRVCICVYTYEVVYVYIDVHVVTYICDISHFKE